MINDPQKIYLDSYYKTLRTIIAADSKLGDSVLQNKVANGILIEDARKQGITGSIIDVLA